MPYNPVPYILIGLVCCPIQSSTSYSSPRVSTMYQGTTLSKCVDRQSSVMQYTNVGCVDVGAAVRTALNLMMHPFLSHKKRLLPLRLSFRRERILRTCRVKAQSWPQSLIYMAILLARPGRGQLPFPLRRHLSRLSLWIQLES